MRKLVLAHTVRASVSAVGPEESDAAIVHRANTARMVDNLNDPRLKTHHLSGQLAGLHACSVGYDCRIVFARQQDPSTGNEVLLLVNIGSHEEVY